ncbi:hypothetical protein Pan14r_20950 [Crateriforma conspicua]|uniref:Uncharacterized protein n=1 Tax=Crateriforma conspicua TaxID=2527996 RepID=A0A5C5Y587_9PLAN|nr:hypothetical protein Pan14r_20950 [Crateriforma conspicua]
MSSGAVLCVVSVGFETKPAQARLPRGGFETLARRSFGQALTSAGGGCPPSDRAFSDDMGIKRWRRIAAHALSNVVAILASENAGKTEIELIHGKFKVAACSLEIKGV